MRARVLAAASVLALVGVLGGGVAAGEDPSPEDEHPPYPPGVTALTTIDVTDEATYRQALIDLSSDTSGPHTINVLADITLDDGPDPTYTGDEDLTIEGNGFTIDAGGTGQILDSESDDADVTINDWTLLNGLSGSAGGAIEADAGMTVRNSVFRGNRTGDSDGGAIDVDDDIVVIDSLFDGNVAGGDSGSDGGAIDTSDEGDVTCIASTFTGNSASSDGGAIEAEGSISATNCTFQGNSTTAVAEDDGGGALNAENDDGNGVVLTYVTMSGNTTGSEGSAIRIETGDTTSDLTSFGSVIVGDADLCAFSGTQTGTATYTDTSDASCQLTGATNRDDVSDPGLGALAANGGPTPTMLPQPGSILIDAIPTSDCDPDVDVDQRGVTRPQIGGCDIGAVEVEAPPPPPPPLVLTPTFTG